MVFGTIVEGAKDRNPEPDRLSGAENGDAPMRCVRGFLILAALSLLLVAPSPAHAADARPARPENNEEVLPEFNFDSPPSTKHHLTSDLTYGAKIGFDFEREGNYDLDDDVDDDLSSLQPELKLAFSYDPDPRLGIFLEFLLLRDFLLEEPAGTRERETELDVRKAYVTIREFLPGLSAQLGRQRFDDAREWIYDDALDAARVFYRIGRFALELSASRKRIVDEDLLSRDRKERINNYFALGHATIGEKSEASVYVLFRDDREDGPLDLLFLGLQSTGELASGLEYWIEAAHVRGESSSKDIRGYGVDVGVTYVLDLPSAPSLTLGAAFGTGDSDPDDEIDRSFRQTGLQDNNARFNGVTSFKYYGETLEPELRNMAILTVGVGVRPTRKSSIDLIYHHYRQHHASDVLRSVNIDADPLGQNRELGHGIDLVMGYREWKNVDVEVVLGAFVPGSAFASDTDNAYFTGVEFQYKF